MTLTIADRPIRLECHCYYSPHPGELGWWIEGVDAYDARTHALLDYERDVIAPYSEENDCTAEAAVDEISEKLTEEAEAEASSARGCW